MLTLPLHHIHGLVNIVLCCFAYEPPALPLVPDYCEVDVPGVRYDFVNYGAGMSLVLPDWQDQVD